MTKTQHILIIEDEATIRRALVEKFIREGFIVDEAINGQDGLDKAMARTPDLILVDVVMPKMDGMTFVMRVKAESALKDVPIIVLTNLSDGTYVESAIRSGVYDFLVKTEWRLEDVVALARRKLSHA
jgi:DNA-binding response OmpR family regulator